MSSNSVNADVSNNFFAFNNVTESSDQNTTFQNSDTGSSTPINAPTEIMIPNMGNSLINNVSLNCKEDTKVVEVNKAAATKTLL
jgi:hypothetical protein